MGGYIEYVGNVLRLYTQESGEFVQNKRSYEMDRNEAQEVHNDFTAQLKEFAESHGWTLFKNRCTYGDTEIKFSVTYRTNGESREEAEETNFKRDCIYYGLKPEDWGAEYKSGGNVYTICGIRPSAKKYPIIGKRSYDGKKFKFPAADVRIQLKEKETV